ncbi:HIT domain-containing protein [bacterium]|nr:HIT domain-containing protein [bacterium]
MQGTLRRDPLNRVWVIFAPEKVRTIVTPSSENEAKFDINPFIPGLEDMTGKNILTRRNAACPGEKWTSRVFPASLPVLKVENSKNPKGDGLYDTMERIGAHEVLVETYKNNVHFDELSESEISDIVSMIRDRVADLKRDTRLKYISVSKNRGRAAGGTIDHNYLEIKAFPFVPESIKAKLANCRGYYESRERCMVCDILEQERKDESRVVIENDRFIAFCPYASRFPFEITVAPRRHSASIDSIDNDEIADLSALLKQLGFKLRSALNSPAYNAIFIQSPLSGSETESEAFHWYLSIIPRISVLSAEALENEIYINPTLPEEAADFLRSIKNDK